MIDEIGAGSERNADMNSILNTLDGVQTKGNNLIVIFTTNHENRINPALRRPGRIDLIVRFEFPDVVTKKKIYEVLMEGTPGADSVDFEEVVQQTPEVQGAVIAEICKRAKKLAQRDGQITTDGMVAAITSMSYQIEFMKERVNETPRDTQLVNLLKGVVGEAAREAAEEAVREAVQEDYLNAEQ